jgi:nucleoside recognition membrane protein YjiH
MLEAEKGGANVTSLTEQLNVAAANLTLAYNRLQQQDYNGTVALAEGCRQTTDNVVTQASVLRGLASTAVPLALWTTVLAWVCSIGMIIFVTAFSWRLFKRRYYRRILTMKLEVVPDESQ